MMRGGFDNEKYLQMQSEHIRQRIDQFGGKLKGWLGFFDAVVVKPQEFENEDGKRMLFGKIKAYSGEESDVEADMANDLKLLTEAFNQRNYHARIKRLDEW
mgnify:CR=1 FL=1